MAVAVATTTMHVWQGDDIYGLAYLRSVGVRAGVSHREKPRLGVLELEVLVLELLPVDAAAPGAVPCGEVAALSVRFTRQANIQGGEGEGVEHINCQPPCGKYGQITKIDMLLPGSDQGRTACYLVRSLTL